jgi:hypothetical protein
MNRKNLSYKNIFFFKNKLKLFKKLNNLWEYIWF